MKDLGGNLQLSATDLVGHLNCRHLTALDLSALRGEVERPFRHDPLLQVLSELGTAHENAYVDHLKKGGFEVCEIEGSGVSTSLVDKTLEAMRKGERIIRQGALLGGVWGGRADILARVEVPSKLGAWSYEVTDTKLAAQTKGNTILQLCLYSDLLGEMQGRTPEHMYVVAPWTEYQPDVYRVADYLAYYRKVRTSMETSIKDPRADDVYPEPNRHCEICAWSQTCDKRRRSDDHLCLVAGISKIQIQELRGRGIEKTSKLAEVPLPLPWKPTRGAVQSYERVREQARLQVDGRNAGKHVFEALPIRAGFGLSCLPEPSKGDIFLDLEGDPFAGKGGLEFLFGYVVIEENGEHRYEGLWANSREEEKAAFESFLDFAMARWRQYPDFHIYHYGHYEPSALKRLMGRYATREDEIDRLLRAIRFVDLLSVVRNGLRASVESYSIKQMEPLYEFVRQTPLPDARGALAQVQGCLEMNDVAGITDSAKQTVIDYNREDCISTAQLRAWLEKLRGELIAKGQQITRPLAEDGRVSEAVNERSVRIAELIAKLTADVPIDEEQRTAEQQARWTLANVLDWHRREDKAVWWEYFRLAALSEEELLDEGAGLSGLKFVGVAGGTAKAPIHRYSFPQQETDLRGGEDLREVGGQKFGKVEDIDLGKRLVGIKKRMDSAGKHVDAVFAHDMVGTEVLAEALFRLGTYVADNGITGAGPYRAARDLLLKCGPQTGETTLRRDGEPPIDAACRLVVEITGGVLPVQGPPGSGKTFTGGMMIAELVRAGKKVGITANSHKVIRHLLDSAIERAAAKGVEISCIQKVSEKHDDEPNLRFTTKNEDVFNSLHGQCQVAGGTAWLWARPDAFETVDVLFVDEAAQMSLANVLAISQAAKSVVLLGDPRQLDQPMQGSHPEGADVSALEHILDGHQTIQAERGLFLEETWRLHPGICSFTSELFYEGRLQPRAGTDLQVVTSTEGVNGSGLRWVPVVHQGNQNCSPQEAERVAKLVQEMLASDARWIDREGKERQIESDDVLIIAPYNAQVFELQERLPNARIGTVDKFQGQEAPIAIYSMATSSPEEAPRGMEFLYSLNRLNVATSRAKCLSIVVASPLLFEAECHTPRQMQLANAFCRFLEMAETVVPAHH